MKHQPLKRLCGLVITAAAALILIGCNGKAGQNGTNGRDGTDGNDGTNATNVVNAALLTSEQWAAMKPTVAITSASIPATGAGTPEVNFRITDPAGNGIKGLGFTTLSTVPDRSGNLATIPGLANFSFALAKLVPESAATKAPSKWVSYVVTTVPAKKPDGTAVAAAPTRPSTDNTGTLVDNGDGTYKYTFYRDIKQMQAFLDGYSFTGNNLKADLGDVAYAPTLVHRVTLQFSGNARGTGSNTPDGVTVATAVPMENPVNAIYDFVPGTGQPVAAGTDIRDIVSINKCNECHDKLAFHGGGRVEARYCVVCHTDQRKYGYAVAAAGTTTTFTGDTRKFAVDGATTIAAGDMTSMVHYIHMGTELSKTGYNYADVKFEKLGYSMLDKGQRMCAKCHSDVPQAANWKSKPGRMACGTCHDGVDFSAAHGNGVIRTDDSACAGCHTPEDIETNHMTPNLTKHNPKVAAGLANFTYEISSASQADVAGVPTLTVKFRILQSVDGSTPAPVTLVAPAATVANPLTGFTGGPGFLLAYAMTQDGVASPADYNNLGSGNANFQPISVSIAQLLSTNNALTMGSLAGPETGTGYYTATMVGTKVFPAGAKLRSVSLQGYFTQVSPAAARHAISVVKALTGDTVRRKVIDSAKCADCHEWFEGHGGNRVYEVQVCVQCHVPGLTTSGKGIPDDRLQAFQTGGPGGASLFTPKDIANLAAWGITIPNPVPVGSNFALTFPQTTNNMKDMIHGLHAGKDRTSPIRIVRNRTNAVAANGAINIINGGTIGFPGILKNCQSCHTYNGYNVPTTGNLLATREEAINPAGNTTTALAAAALATANAGDKMITPFTAACVTCHDSAPAKAHMTSFGGQILVDRSAMNMAGESCAVCHGVGSTYDPVKAHK